MPADDAEELFVVDEALEKVRGVRAVVAFGAYACRALRSLVLERVVDERGEAQPPPLVRRRRIALDVREHVGDAVLDRAFRVPAPRLAPPDSFPPLRFRGDTALKLCFEVERQCFAMRGSVQEVGLQDVSLPVRPPLAPMLARLARELPADGYLYEPK